MRKPLPIFLHALLLIMLLPVCSTARETDYKVTQILNGKSFVLASGDTVRLAGIAVPNVQEASTATRSGRSGEPLGEEAKQALEKLISNQSITLQLTDKKRDRHNRLLGQAYAGSTWLQGAMLNEGYAMVYSFSDTPHDLTQKMLAEERSARAAKRGIWSHPYYRIITPEETPEYINRFKLVEGKVESVRMSHGNIYINFFKEWKGRFALFISRKHAEAFAGSNLNALEGKTIRVRGWINYHNAPMINLSHPGEIETD
jgi:micrococcal nuclease